MCSYEVNPIKTTPPYRALNHLSSCTVVEGIHTDENLASLICSIVLSPCPPFSVVVHLDLFVSHGMWFPFAFRGIMLQMLLFKTDI